VINTVLLISLKGEQPNPSNQCKTYLRARLKMCLVDGYQISEVQGPYYSLLESLQETQNPEKNLTKINDLHPNGDSQLSYQFS